MAEKKLYLAYGSNLDTAQMKRRCPGARAVGETDISGKLVFRGSRSGYYLTVIPAETGEVPVAVWQVTPDDEARLDMYEGCPAFYRKVTIPVEYWDFRNRSWAEAEAFIYALPLSAPAGLPRTSYLNTCLRGYEEFGFNPVLLFEAYREACEQVYAKNAKNQVQEGAGA